MENKKLIPVLMVLITVFLGCQGGKMQSVPDELQGVWKTSEPGYADRFFELRHNTFIFGLDNGELDSYTINYLKMKSDRDSKSTVYTFYYEDEEGEEYILSMFYYPKDNGVIKVQYQEDIIWTREKHI